MRREPTAAASARCAATGKREWSVALSSIRTAAAVNASRAASGLKGSVSKLARLLARSIRSMKITPSPAQAVGGADHPVPESARRDGLE